MVERPNIPRSGGTPGITLVIYGILADVHIGGLILAGFVPGIFSALVLGVYVVIKAKIGKPGYGRPPAKELSGATAASQSEGNADAESGADSGAAPGVGNARIAAAAATAMGLNISQAVTTPARATSGPNLLRACICAARCRAAACVARQPVDRRWQR